MKFTTHFELHSQTTRLVEGVSHGPYRRSKTGFSPSLTFCSKKFKPRRYPKHPLQITTRTLKRPDFKFELLPLHSPLLRQSLLVSFPPLIDMLKFSGYPYLIRGQPSIVGLLASIHRGSRARSITTLRAPLAPPLILRAAETRTPRPLAGLVIMTLEQACPPEYQGAQCAFKDSMIH